MILHFDLVSETEIAALALAFFSSRSQRRTKNLPRCRPVLTPSGRMDELFVPAACSPRILERVGRGVTTPRARPV
jgi:hypothetical protein